MQRRTPYRIAIVKWADSDGVASAIHDELARLGHDTLYFKFDEVIPRDADVVFTFAPYGRFLPIASQLASMPVEKQPTLVHWSTENPPDLRLPWPVMRIMADWRSSVDRLHDSERAWARALVRDPPLTWIDSRLFCFRYLGEFRCAHRLGWLDLFIEASDVFARFYSRHGLPALFVPWGTVRSWHADLNLDRDIDVLWMGKRRNRRRSNLLDSVREQLAKLGVQMYIADNVENPFIFGEQRTRILNRAKITLNLQTTWYPNILQFRYAIAATNRSLVLSEPILPHVPVCKAGEHYVSAPPHA